MRGLSIPLANSEVILKSVEIYEGGSAVAQSTDISEKGDIDEQAKKWSSEKRERAGLTGALALDLALGGVTLAQSEAQIMEMAAAFFILPRN